MERGFDYTGVVVTFCCHDGQGNILMHRRGANARDEQGAWDVGGGALEFGERAEDALRREIAEEYGATIRAVEPLGFRDAHRVHDGRPTHWIGLDFKVLIDRASAKNNEPHKFDEMGWFTAAALPSPLHSQLPKYFEQYQGRI
jgi:8-oxo-dGTP pyrophosphatase MutT (NUDIX family)